MYFQFSNVDLENENRSLKTTFNIVYMIWNCVNKRSTKTCQTIKANWLIILTIRVVIIKSTKKIMF